MATRLAKITSRSTPVLEGGFIALPLLLFIFIPKPPVANVQFLTYPVMGGAVFMMLLYVALRGARLPRNGDILFIIALLYGVGFLIAISQTVNFGEIRTTGIVTPMKQILHILTFVYAVVVGAHTPPSTLRTVLYRTAVFIVIAQSIISMLQLLDAPLIGLIYSEEKTHGLGRSFRFTGSMANPNVLGMVVTLAMLIILNLGRGLQRFFLVLLSFALILVSGSRSMLIMFCLGLAINNLARAYFLEDNRKLFEVFKTLFLFGVLLAVALVVIINFSNIFQYQSELLKLTGGSGLEAVGSFAKRIENWQNGWRYFLESPAWHKWWIGLGSHPFFRVGDNDWFYVIWHYGLFGLLANLILIAALYKMIGSIKQIPLRAIAFTWLTILVGLSFAVDTFSGWFNPIILLFLVGLIYAHGPAERVASVELWTERTSAHPGG